MRLATRSFLIMMPSLLAAGTLPACGGKSPEPQAPAPPSPAAPAPQAATSAPAASDAASTTPSAEVFVFARLPHRAIADQEIIPRLDALEADGRKLDGAILRETIEDVVDDALLAHEAQQAGFVPPADATGDEAIAEAWARDRFLPDARTSVSDADLAAWFAERRGLARMIFKDESAATKLASQLEDKRAAGGGELSKLFLEAKQRRLGRRGEVVPDGVLVDARGKNELGEVVVPEEAARVLFTLEEGVLSPPTQVGDVWMLMMNLGARPGTPLDKVPESERQAAHDRIAAARAMDRLEEHVARLRKDLGVTIDEAAVKRFAMARGLSDLSKLRRLPFAQRKAELSRSRVMPNRAPMRPAGRDIQRLMEERQKKLREESGQPKGEGANP